MEGNRRLHHVWEQFNKRGKLPVKANTAVARELAGWCWSVAAPLQEKAARRPIFTGGRHACGLTHRRTLRSV